MGKAKIAPVLQDFIRYYGHDGHPMRKEVAALLAVARAARRIPAYVLETPEGQALYRALSRLRRAGKGGGK